MPRRLSVLVVTPAPRGSRKGNRVTAERWARILRSLGHRVRIATAYRGEAADVLLALHARRSAPAVFRFRRARPGGRVIVALTGTDLYLELARSRTARRALEAADRLVVLQPLAIRALPAGVRSKARAILQSALAPRRPPRPRADAFDVCVLGHLRPVKDPFRAALASRLLPEGWRLRVIQVGAALSAAMARRARAEQRRNPRYLWLGELPRAQALRALARCRLLVLSSRAEGGANVVSEAIACGVPVLSSRIDGSIGLLGRDYPAYFRVGDTPALARLLLRAETDPSFYLRLRRACERVRPLFTPARERRAWRRLLQELD